MLRPSSHWHRLVAPCSTTCRSSGQLHGRAGRNRRLRSRPTGASSRRSDAPGRQVARESSERRRNDPLPGHRDALPPRTRPAAGGGSSAKRGSPRSASSPRCRWGTNRTPPTHPSSARAGRRHTPRDHRSSRARCFEHDLRAWGLSRRGGARVTSSGGVRFPRRSAVTCLVLVPRSFLHLRDRRRRGGASGDPPRPHAVSLTRQGRRCGEGEYLTATRWRRRLDELGATRTPIAEMPLRPVVIFRDPHGIQVEFFLDHC